MGKCGPPDPSKCPAAVPEYESYCPSDEQTPVVGSSFCAATCNARIPVIPSLDATVEVDLVSVPATLEFPSDGAPDGEAGEPGESPRQAP